MARNTGTTFPSIRRALPLLCGLLCLGTCPSGAGQREVLTGTIKAAPLDSVYDYLFQYRDSSEPAMALLSGGPDESILALFPRQRIEVEREVFVSVGGFLAWTNTWPREADRGTILRVLPDELLAPGGVPLSPERWAGASTSLHPTLHANQPFEVSGPTDYDGDGVPDHVDAFPANPAESADNDKDGKGDNADPDDDNDQMSDVYEKLNGLDPGSDDSQGDADGDGFTNGQEYAAGTDAQDGSSTFHIKSASIVSEEKFRIEWYALPGRRYEIWHRPQLAGRGERLAQGIRVTEPGDIARNVPTLGNGDFYFLLVIPDPL